MAIKISGSKFKPKEGGPYVQTWRIYGTSRVFYPTSSPKPKPGTWELVREFELERARGRVGFPTIELEPTDNGGYKFYQLVAVDAEGKETWHPDSELTLPSTLPDEFEPPFDFGTWILWNLERQGVIAPGQLND